MSDLPQDDIEWINKWFRENKEPAHPQFAQDLEEKGKPCEIAVLKYIKKFDSQSYIVDGFDPDKDIVAPTIDKTFEVKNCQDAEKNVPIEIAILNQNGEHLSGLSRSKATYWVIYCKEEYHMILTETLRGITDTITPKEYKIHDQKVTLKILPITELKKYSKHIFN